MHFICIACQINDYDSLDIAMTSIVKIYHCTSQSESLTTSSETARSCCNGKIFKTAEIRLSPPRPHFIDTSVHWKNVPGQPHQSFQGKSWKSKWINTRQNGGTRYDAGSTKHYKLRNLLLVEVGNSRYDFSSIEVGCCVGKFSGIPQVGKQFSTAHVFEEHVQEFDVVVGPISDEGIITINP